MFDVLETVEKIRTALFWKSRESMKKCNINSDLISWASAGGGGGRRGFILSCIFLSLVRFTSLEHY